MEQGYCSQNENPNIDINNHRGISDNWFCCG